eukprot:COSAG01_NODE_657_length_14457_cov_99.379649_2_plen_39_part_00
MGIILSGGYADHDQRMLDLRLATVASYLSTRPRWAGDP